jgi:TolA-binding protein
VSETAVDKLLAQLEQHRAASASVQRLLQNRLGELAEVIQALDGEIERLREENRQLTQLNHIMAAQVADKLVKSELIKNLK